MNEKDLFVAPSLYSLFLYTIINPDWTKSDYVLSDRVPLVVHQRLRNLFKMDVYTYYGGAKVEKNLFKRFYLLNKYYFEYLKYSKLHHNYRAIYGNDEFPASFPYRMSGMYLVEDGSFNSESKGFFIKKKWRQEIFYIDFWFHRMFQNYLQYGWDKHVKGIYHTPSIVLQPEIASKGIEIDLKDKWASFSLQRKLDILSLFGIDNELLVNINQYDTVLVTQDLPIPDEDKIKIYKRMLEGLDLSSLLIKTHYAEKTDYKKVFPLASVISMPVPMQLFDLLGYQPKKVLTISSGAVTPFIKEGVEVVFLGTEVDQRIVNKYGIVTLDTYMKK